MWMTLRLMMTKFPEVPFPDQHSDSTLTVYNPSGRDLPVDPAELNHLLQQVEDQEQVTFSDIELVYVDEDEIVNINREYLDRDYVTDIITFGYNDDDDTDASSNRIEGTLYCCAPRISEQSLELSTSEKVEFYRVFVHGLLHLAGYSDSSEGEKSRMRMLENRILEQTELDR